jgi:hypothetical protein
MHSKYRNGVTQVRQRIRWFSNRGLPRPEKKIWKLKK